MANVIQNLQDAFSKKMAALDTNHDGHVSREEAEEAAREHFGGKTINALGYGFVAGVAVATVVFLAFKLFTPAAGC